MKRVNSNTNIKISSNSDDVTGLVDKKLTFFNDIIQKTILNVQKNKLLGMSTTNDVNSCIGLINLISEKIKIFSKKVTTDIMVSNLQTINNDISALLKIYGTELLEDLITICFGNDKVFINDESDLIKYDLLKKYFHPTSYKILNSKIKPEESKESKESKENDECMNEKSNNFECSDISISSKNFRDKVYGMKLYIRNISSKKNLIIYGMVDDVIMHLMDNNYINKKMKYVKDNLPQDAVFQDDTFYRYLISLSLKDLLIHEYSDIYSKYMGYVRQHKLFRQKTLNNMVKEFVSGELFVKRNMLIQLLINSDTYENKYMAYLLYDLLSNDVNGIVDTQEQSSIFDSFTFPLKQYFKDAMKKTTDYTNELAHFDINKIPLEQQICLMKASENVKEKAMIKLKEVKSKSEDSGSKARQYLDGLLNIPFNIYIKEPVLYLMDENRKYFKELVKNIKDMSKDTYTSIEIIQYLKKINNTTLVQGIENIVDSSYLIEKLLEVWNKFDKSELKYLITVINSNIKKYSNKTKKINYSGKTMHELKDSLIEFINSCYKDITVNFQLLNEISMLYLNKGILLSNENDVIKINNNFKLITEYIKNVKNILDKSVYGHEKAKHQIERIIGQWINGEQNGYCFGFEGPPGVGKTSLSKHGLSNCLKDENGNSRPFAMIQLGGDSNGSTLNGHNYTYVGSTWGSIVQILMDKKCMNPIIFIDEIDKISRTEHGKEIVGILTHLLDPTQNDIFQDKYFSGIHLDLSKALFILSYNDVDAIDKVLLDRIHRIKFESLSLEDKLVISKTHMLPEVYKKFGLENIIDINDDTLKFIIENYTCESGVRKLKEKLFEIVGEINVNILKNIDTDYVFPIKISIDDVKTKYFKDKPEVKIKLIHNHPEIGIINCLWANSLGQGGILPTNGRFIPSDKFFDLRLTGLLDDMMKESMYVAQTLSWNLTNIKVQEELRERYDGTYKYGFHLHAGDGSIHKSGTSAGIAISILIYSLLNNLKINNTFGVTGEANLDGSVNEIGALKYKFIGGIKAGIKSFIFPKENLKDYNDFMEKYGKTDIVDGISFYPISHIKEAFDLIFV